MPELPEVETLRRDLQRRFVGRRIERVSADGVHRLRRSSPAGELVGRMTDRSLLEVRRRGKYLVAHLDSRDAVIIHLGMSGQLRAASAVDPLAPHSHVIIDWYGGGQLRLVDPRTFGELFVTATDPVDGSVAQLAHLGFDALDTELSSAAAAALLSTRRGGLKALLMNQRFIAGIGNLYADEILWTAKLAAQLRACDLTPAQVRRLWRARRDVLSRAVAARGSSLADAQYRDLNGMIGRFQGFHQAYGREGLACARCRTAIVRVRWAGRSSFSCPRCQPGPPDAGPELVVGLS